MKRFAVVEHKVAVLFLVSVHCLQPTLHIGHSLD